MKSTLIKVVFCFIFILGLTFLYGQNIYVIHIEGQVSLLLGDEKKSGNLVHGPISENSIIILDKNERVKLIRSKNEICDLKIPGKYKVNQLPYQNTGNNSILGRFCEYFHSFFTNHSSPEAKSAYKSSISAISRGNMAIPKLDFPLQGDLALDAGPITFMWSHTCDTCTYALKIYNFNTKKLIYEQSSKQTEITISNPETQFIDEVKYYWKVEVVGFDLEYLVNTFNVAPKGQFDKNIFDIDYRLGIEDFEWVGTTPKCIYIMSELAALHKPNFAIQYGRSTQIRHPDNIEIKGITENFLYSNLLNNGE